MKLEDIQDRLDKGGPFEIQEICRKLLKLAFTVQIAEGATWFGDFEEAYSAVSKAYEELVD